MLPFHITFIIAIFVGLIANAEEWLCCWLINYIVSDSFKKCRGCIVCFFHIHRWVFLLKFCIMSPASTVQLSDECAQARFNKRVLQTGHSTHLLACWRTLINVPWQTHSTTAQYLLILHQRAGILRILLLLLIIKIIIIIIKRKQFACYWKNKTN